MAKKTKPVAPQNTVEANASLFRIGAIDRAISGIESALEAEIARLRNDAIARLEPLINERKSRLAGLEEFADTNRATILEKGKKSVEFSAGTIGWRTTPPKVVLARGGEKKALETLKRLKMKQYIRTKESVDKELLLRERPDIVGIKYDQREEFFVEAKTVTGPEAAENVVAMSKAA